ncbi:Helix-turn-helix domain-containing protein [Micromonospora pattaloongensis]|uniref:Helix-turn-helix domain-containing protein n=1 Tax=Micromonospora pattaloongensis TaxID=405436 RepID=A0A1H3KHB1_9ACTN|nr:helix-turn-helix transcriptional regulator [Micromonospora pattaloongensis]SDY51537.1 Helix-turn-helix domain-containing protein [Micromonospora pattaloongensis]
MGFEHGFGELPAVARRRVRLALRDAREARGLTRGQVAEALDWSVSKITRIEKGDVTVSTTDLRALLELCGVTDGDRVRRLLADARASRRRGWWDEPGYREHLTPALRQMLQFESEASLIRHFHPTLIAGPLQTRAYAEFIMNFWSSEMPAADRAARLEARLRRGVEVFDQTDPPRYLYVFDESVLWRVVGGPRVMAEQLRHLLDLTARPDIVVRVVPLADAAITGMLGPFTIFDLGDEENAVLYRESLFLDEILHSGAAIERHRGYFDQMWQAALGEEASARLIGARLAALMADSGMVSGADAP